MSYKTVAIACPALPCPVRDPQTGTIGTVRHMQIQTRLSAEKAIGFLHRNYAPPSMSHTMLQLVKYASDSITKPGASPLIALLGKKGVGKTSAAEAAYYLVDGEMPEVFDCGNRSLDELLWEPFLADSSKNLTGRLEERFNNGTLNPLNRAYFQVELPEAIKTDAEGKETLDFLLVGPERITKAVEVMKTTLELEGIAAVVGIDLSYKEGPLIRIWKEAKEAQARGEEKPCRLIIDEIDKRIPNSGKSLQQVWLVIQGLRESHTVAKNGMSFTFSHKEIPRGFSTVITGNDASDLGGETQAGLSQSMATRMTILPIGESDEDDLTHRICQFLTGVPFGILEVMPQDDATKADILRQLRTLGTEDSLSHEESWLIENHGRTLSAAKQLAKFYDYWAQLVDPENPLLDDGDIERNSAFREPPGVRMAHKHIESARKNDLLEISFEAPAASKDPLRDLLSQKEFVPSKTAPIGERVSRVILEAIAKTAGTEMAKAKLLEAAVIAGLIPNPDEENNPNSAHRSIASLLNDQEETFRIAPETRELQKKLYESLLKTHGAKFGSNPPEIDEILPLRDLQAAVTAQDIQAKNRETGKTTFILNINPNYLDGNHKEKAVECIPVLCPRSEKHLGKLQAMGREKVYGAMMSTDTLRAILTTADIGESTLEALWNKGWKNDLRKSLLEDSTLTEDEESPECIRMADGSSDDLRIARTLTMGQNGPEASLIFQSKTRRKTWMISENGPNEKFEAVNCSLTCYAENDAKTLVQDVQVDMDENAQENIAIALRAFHTPIEEDLLPEVMISNIVTASADEKKTGSRHIQNTKIPLRIPENELESIG